MSTIKDAMKERVQQHFSVDTVRSLLNLDNKGIAQLCAQVSLMPRKEASGRTYFTKNDIEILRKRKNLNEKQVPVKRSVSAATNPTGAVAPQKINKAYASMPARKASVRRVQPVANEQAVEIRPQTQEKFDVPALPKKTDVQDAANLEKIVSSLTSIENSIMDKLDELFEEKLGKKLDEKFDEKLDGMDEVVVELVRCKTENETLRYKMNELNKEVYNLKNELSKYKSLGLGFYIKKNGDSSLL